MPFDEKGMAECFECTTMRERKQTALRAKHYARYLFLDWLLDKHVAANHYLPRYV